MKTVPVSIDQDVLNTIYVRLIHPSEMDSWNHIIKEEHYLHSDKLSGHILRYVAEYQQQWVALLSFSAAAYHIKARDAWIGWCDMARKKRLPLILVTDIVTRKTHSRLTLLGKTLFLGSKYSHA